MPDTATFEDKCLALHRTAIALLEDRDPSTTRLPRETPPRRPAADFVVACQPEFLLELLSRLRVLSADGTDPGLEAADDPLVGGLREGVLELRVALPRKGVLTLHARRLDFVLFDSPDRALHIINQLIQQARALSGVPVGGKVPPGVN